MRLGTDKLGEVGQPGTSYEGHARVDSTHGVFVDEPCGEPVDRVWTTPRTVVHMSWTTLWTTPPWERGHSV